MQRKCPPLEFTHFMRIGNQKADEQTKQQEWTQLQAIKSKGIG